MKLMIRPNGEEHGLVKTVANSVNAEQLGKFHPKIKEKALKEKADDEKIVKARYINYKGENERLTKPYCRWAGEPIHTFHLIPNEIYELPKGFIKEVNSCKGLVQRSELLDAKGIPLATDKYIKEHELVPCTFE